MKKSTWVEFQDSGLLWFVNRTLHIFGWSIVFECADDGTVADVYPARTTWLGFDEATDEAGQKKFLDEVVRSFS